MTLLRKLCRRHKSLKSIYACLIRILGVSASLLLVSLIISNLFHIKPILNMIFFTTTLITLVATFLAAYELKDLKADIKYEVASVIYTAFRKIFDDDEFDEEMFGYIDYVGITSNQIFVNIDIFNCDIPREVLVESIMPTVKLLRRVTTHKVKLYYFFN